MLNESRCRFGDGLEWAQGSMSLMAGGGVKFALPEKLSSLSLQHCRASVWSHLTAVKRIFLYSCTGRTVLQTVAQKLFCQ